MKILHTSDWHLGCSLHGRKRYDEQEAFLGWLLETLSSRGIDLLLVSGDIFDSTMPSNRALALYYRFLHQVSATCCGQVVIIGGNHDSPSLLAAPRDLLKHLNIHVVAAISDTPDDEIITIPDPQSGRPALIVCAVPYLRDRDIRSSQAGESPEDKAAKLLEGIAGHYREICDRAEQLRAGQDLPLIVMGHLFAAGARLQGDDGERQLYVGSLAHLPLERLPGGIDYLALGHLHRPQCLGAQPHLRYSGSPLPMSFAGGSRTHSVCLLTCNGKDVVVETLEVPLFRPLVSIRGNLTDILARLSALSSELPAAWIEVHYTSTELVGSLQQQIVAAVEGTGLEILRVINTQNHPGTMARTHDGETLDSLTAEQVFRRCLAHHSVPEDQHPLLLETFRETMLSLYEEDPSAN